MADIEFRNVDKSFPDGSHAINNLSLRVDDGEFMVVVGPSGSGKSTLLRLLAGLETVSAGDILIGGSVVNHWPPQRRNIAMVFQDYALYPHMTVRENLGFPLRMQRLSKDEIARRIDETANLLGLAPFLNRRPGQLSGGQRQRVAMGRAVVRRPGVFLMDEPLSNVDAKLRVQIRTEIAALHDRLETTTLYVTHDQVEAMTLGDRVMVLRDGTVQQVASPQDLYDRPANAFVATFLGNPGMNIIAAGVMRDGGDVALNLYGRRVPLAGRIRDGLTASASTVLIGLRPEALRLGSGGSASVRLPVTVSSVESLGHEQLVHGRLPPPAPVQVQALDRSLPAFGATPGHLVARLPASPICKAGDALELWVDLRHIHLFEADGRRCAQGIGGEATRAAAS